MRNGRRFGSMRRVSWPASSCCSAPTPSRTTRKTSPKWTSDDSRRRWAATSRPERVQSDLNRHRESAMRPFDIVPDWVIVILAVLVVGGVFKLFGGFGVLGLG